MRSKQDHAVGGNAAPDEGQRLLAGRIHPVHVVREYQHRLLGRRLGDQVERGHRDGEQVGRRVRLLTERDVERLATMSRQPD